MSKKDLVNEKFYTLEELCQALKEKGRRVTKTMLTKYIKAGHLKATEVDGAFIIKESDVDWNIHADRPSDYDYYDEEFLEFENKNQGIDQNLETESEGVVNMLCSICGCDLTDKGPNVRYKRGYIFCRKCFSETQ